MSCASDPNNRQSWNSFSNFDMSSKRPFKASSLVLGFDLDLFSVLSPWYNHPGWRGVIFYLFFNTAITTSLRDAQLKHVCFERASSFKEFSGRTGRSTGKIMVGVSRVQEAFISVPKPSTTARTFMSWSPKSQGRIAQILISTAYRLLSLPSLIQPSGPSNRLPAVLFH